ncbi:octanoyl-[GcvH]:protein N-octanoyltransferase [Ammoniphilus resinae]|uniref:Octanoyl-[GcvH]:protein N-octanoyltransferase n=2 Tax=Ammoniphilus resinae TaxID=861532 RepID=A0ABS4GTL5_9BACL|nr:octanoyl-[GcvH]:protein N-octanoyltransferase [Ammoniphilus resinae]
MKELQLPSSFHLMNACQDLYQGDILYPFAVDEVLCRKIGEGSVPPLVHIWRHQKAFVLGLRDRKLPNAEDAMAWLEAQGYQVSVRNSGGAAVPLAPGVLNLSLILPNPQGVMEFHQDFETMFQIIRRALAGITAISKGEIKGSYCPGDFDLSIDGRKFCGIAQRRQTKAFVVQAFIVVTGDGTQMADLVRQFYQVATGGQQKGAFPAVEPDQMASLEQLVGLETLDQFMQPLMDLFSAAGGVVVDSSFLHPFEEEIRDAIPMLRSRYERRG